jgi:hypothetical protein
MKMSDIQKATLKSSAKLWFKEKGIKTYEENKNMTQILTPTEPTVQEERITHEIKLVLVNGRVTLNGKTFNELNPFEVIIFNTLIIQEREQINELLNI